MIVDKLESIYVEKSYPTGKGTMKARQEMMKKLSKECGLTFEQLRRWFDNRTQKEKRLRRSLEQYLEVSEKLASHQLAIGNDFMIETPRHHEVF